MLHPGREAATDLKRRLVAACEEVGLDGPEAKMFLHGGVRHIYAWRRPVELSAEMTTSGHWLGLVTVKCSTASPEFPNPFQAARTMRHVPLGSLIDVLLDILNQREKVIVAMKSGVPGPYTFGETRWSVTNDEIAADVAEARRRNQDIARRQSRRSTRR